MHLNVVTINEEVCCARGNRGGRHLANLAYLVDRHAQLLHHAVMHAFEIRLHFVRHRRTSDLSASKKASRTGASRRTSACIAGVMESRTGAMSISAKPIASKSRKRAQSQVA